MEQLTLVNYALNSALPVNRYAHNTFLEVHFSREQLQQAARHMKKRCLWGDGVYTADSDLFCALIHQGYLPWRSLEPSYSWPDNMRELHAIIEVLPSPDSYSGCSQNGIRSRSWGSSCHNCSFSIRRCWMAVLLTLQPPTVCSHLPICAPFSCSHTCNRFSYTVSVCRGAIAARRLMLSLTAFHLGRSQTRQSPSLCSRILTTASPPDRSPTVVRQAAAATRARLQQCSSTSHMSPG